MSADKLLNFLRLNVALACAVALSLLLAWTVIERPYNNAPPIRSDGAGYHVWVYGLMNSDFSFCAYRPLLDPTASISLENKAKNICGVKYPPGVGLLQLPFVAFWASDSTFAAYAPAVHTAILWLGAVLCFFVAFFSYKSLALLGCSTPVGLIAIACFLFGSGLFHYATYDASFSHVYSAFGVSALAWLAIRGNKRGWSFFTMGLLGLLVFWLQLVRPTNGAITLMLTVLIALQTQSRAMRIQISLVWIIGVAAGLGLQVAYNFYVSGEIRISSYGQEAFVGLGLHSADVFLSYERGLFTYYPIFLVTIVGASLVWRDKLTFGFMILTALFALVYGSWHSWYLGGGMGHRGFVELAPLGILVLGMALDRMPKGTTQYFYPLLAGCVGVTVIVTAGYWQGSFPYAGANSEIFWTHLSERGLILIAFVGATTFLDFDSVSTSLSK